MRPSSLVRSRVLRRQHKIVATQVMPLLALLWAAPASAQTRGFRAARESSGVVVPVVSQFVRSLTSQAKDKVFDFLGNVELFDIEGEVNRLVGSPWELHDSTAYKLRLLPLHLTYPVYERLAGQMIGHDERRGEHIYNVGPDSVTDEAVRLDPLATDPLPQDLFGSILGHFSPREIADIAVFALAQQPLFPQTDEKWHHRVVARMYALALVVEGAPGTLESLRDRMDHAREQVEQLQGDQNAAPLVEAERAELQLLAEQMRAASRRALGALHLYEHLRAAVRRMVATSDEIVRVRHFDLVSAGATRRIALLAVPQ